jgi:1-acyl-sn-glycerol-3-phosphate acyltransferase
MMKPSRSTIRWLRGILRLLLFLFTALQGCAHFLVLRIRCDLTTTERAAWLHRWCRLALERLHIPIAVQGAFPEKGLLVSNHLSYLDILVFSALSPCVFVAKREVRSWPLFGLMAKMGGTVFVDRTRTTDAPRANTEMSQALADGAVVVLFPEGTSSDGTTVLPFRPALFEAAVAAGESVSSAHISYELDEGSVARDVCYWGSMTFFPHLLRLLSKPAVRARVQFAMETSRFDDRKRAAQVTRAAVSALAAAPTPRSASAGITYRTPSP